ncbi:flagellar brake protein [Leeia sp. TBRC 13508]|uniref:Flagellar brake protein YcgR n=1 Tax=Leeia speluncae TaxID=2884804 RepID=A0ABS8D5B8_9NEIS|nr:flagellar brake protein [Leeia speluncae]MCB6183404.1 flagellar brake protein [Leeia speluncae]
MSDTENQATENHTPVAPTDDLARFTLMTPIEIVYALRNLIRSKQTLAIYFRQGKESMLTTLLDVNSEKGELIFDWGGSETVNQHLLDSDRNVFVCAPEGVKIQFVTGKINQIQLDGKPAFSTRLPDTLIKIQRREFYRLQMPIANPFWVTIHGTPKGSQRFTMFDLSLGGVCLNVSEPELFHLMENFGDCQLDLKEAGLFDVALQVRNLSSVPQRNGTVQHRMGCQFVGKFAHIQNKLQRFLAQLERERNALLKRD